MFNNIKKNYIKEPIIIAGKILGIRLLSAYETILCQRKYLKILNCLEKNKDICVCCKKLLKKACLISMFLCDSSNNQVFPDAVEVLKSLTTYEISCLYVQYLKVINNYNEYTKRNCIILENIKKHGSQQILQKVE